MSFWAMCAHFPQPTKSFAHHSVPSQITKLRQNAAIHPHKHRHEGHLRAECFVLAYVIYIEGWQRLPIKKIHMKYDQTGLSWSKFNDLGMETISTSRPGHVLKFQVMTCQPSFRGTKLIKPPFFPPIDGNMKPLNPKEFHMISSASIPRNSRIFCLFGLCGSPAKMRQSNTSVFRFGKRPGKQHGRF